jgi:hypothetical protein
MRVLCGAPRGLLASAPPTSRERDARHNTSEDRDCRAGCEADTGLRPPFALEAFADPDADVRQSLRRVRASPTSRTATRCGGSSTRSRAGG